MSDPLMDFQCYVGSYEVRPVDELPAKDQEHEHDPPNMLHLLQTGKAKLVKPKRAALDMAVQLLLKTQMPKWRAAQDRRNKELLFEMRRRGDDTGVREMRRKEIEIDPDEFSNLKRNVLAISRHIGMLGRSFDGKAETDLGYHRHEFLGRWIQLAQDIQLMFFGREAQRKLQKDVGRAFGSFEIFLSFKSDGGTSVQIHPNGTHDALIYHAAQMISGGTTFQTCVNCGTPFLGGGAHGRSKKRADARFCSDKCRWTHHNKARLKAR